MLTSVKLDLPNQITLLQSTAKKLYHFVQIKKIVSRCFGNQSKILIPLFWDLNKIVSPCLKKKLSESQGPKPKHQISKVNLHRISPKVDKWSTSAESERLHSQIYFKLSNHFWRGGVKHISMVCSVPRYMQVLRYV